MATPKTDITPTIHRSDPPGPAIEAVGLRKRFGARGRAAAALDGVTLTVPAGTVCGLLGPNGAGKTTTVRILATLLRPDGGTARVAGHDVARHPDRVRRAIGLIGQHAAVDELLTGRQNLVMFGRLHHLDTRSARRRAGELLDRFGLTDAADRPAGKYSGGMRRRLDLAAGMVRSPAVLFLDEPTTGLDPHGRAEVWRAVRGLVADGTTVLLTTQYLDEADQLADRICVLGAGRVIAEGSPDALKSATGGDRLDVVPRHADDLGRAAALVARVAGATAEVDRDTRRVSAPVSDRAAALTALAPALADTGLAAADLEDIAVRRPTLDEVFLHLTGHDTEHTEQTEVRA